MKKRKSFFCYGCGCGGTIVKVVSEYFCISLENAINLLYSYINNDLDSLNKKQLEMIKIIFKDYDSSSYKYFEESKKKTTLLNNRIDNYIENYGTSSDTIKKMTKRLCCSRKYIENRISELTDNINNYYIGYVESEHALKKV